MDSYFKKEITYTYKGERLEFDVAETLFSTFSIDHGTDILIRAISTSNPRRILDIGCGYGPLGICMAKINPKSEVVLTDRDLLAVKYANSNIKKNNVSNATALGSLGVDGIDGQFDLILSNIPAKIGDTAITNEFIMKPYEKLAPGGTYWFVIVSALNRLIPKVIKDNHLHAEEVRRRNGHIVYKITKMV